MRSAFLKGLLLTAVAFTTPGCGRQSSPPLTSSEELQSLVLRHVILHYFRGLERTAPGDFRLFLSTDDPWADPSAAVLASVSATYRSARPFTAANQSGFKVAERGTLAPGGVIYIAPFTITGEAALTVSAGYHVGRMTGAHFEYRVQQIQGVWTILDRQMSWIT